MQSFIDQSSRDDVALSLTAEQLDHLTAAIEALGSLTRPSPVALYTDSQYLRQGISTWIKNWKRNGWKTRDRSPVKNADLWQALDTLIARHDVAWHWVRGHAGHDINERADALARKGMAPFLRARRGSAAAVC